MHFSGFGPLLLYLLVTLSNATKKHDPRTPEKSLHALASRTAHSINPNIEPALREVRQKWPNLQLWRIDMRPEPSRKDNEAHLSLSGQSLRVGDLRTLPQALRTIIWLSDAQIHAGRPDLINVMRLRDVGPRFERIDEKPFPATDFVHHDQQSWIMITETDTTFNLEDLDQLPPDHAFPAMHRSADLRGYLAAVVQRINISFSAVRGGPHLGSITYHINTSMGKVTIASFGQASVGVIFCRDVEAYGQRPACVRDILRLNGNNQWSPAT